MSEKKYLMADVAAKLEIPPYMLRYYEDELAINIPRNARGLRYYRKQEIELFKSVISLKQKGFDIAAIRIVLDDIHRIEKLPPEKLLELRDRLDSCIKSAAGTGITMQHCEEKQNSLTTGAEVTSLKKADNSTGLSQEEKLERFRALMTDIIVGALKVNNNDLSRQINYTVTDSVTREMNYVIQKNEQVEEERFKTLVKRLKEVCAAIDRK